MQKGDFMGMTDWKDKKVILFDLDGTLTDPGIGITNSVMHALKHYGIAVPERSELYKFIGPPLSESFEKYYGFSETEAVKAVEVYREYFGTKGLFENELYEGIDDLLRTLKDQGKILGLATSKPEYFAEQILEHFHLRTYFDFVSGSLLNGERTDKGEVIHWALDNLKKMYGDGIAETAVMVGDREHDALGASKNNIPVIGVLFGYGSREEFESAGADGVAESVPELYELLTGETFREV